MVSGVLDGQFFRFCLFAESRKPSHAANELAKLKELINRVNVERPLASTSNDFDSNSFDNQLAGLNEYYKQLGAVHGGLENEDAAEFDLTSGEDSSSSSADEQQQLVDAAADQMDKRSTAYLRFGKRSNSGVPPAYLRFGRGQPYLRFGKRSPNAYLRFGKRNPAYLRFGRK